MEDPRSTSADSRKRAREGDTSGRFDPIESAEVKRLREDLLTGFFDDSDPEPVAQDLDSLIRSFQEEISTAPMPQAVEVVDLTSETGESGELGYLLGASDDDLGLPPRLRPEVIDDLWSQEAEQAGGAPYDSLWGWEGHVDVYDDGIGGFGGGTSYGSYDEGYEYVAFDGGLFEYSDVGFDPSDDLSDLRWRRGSVKSKSSDEALAYIRRSLFYNFF